MFASARIPQIYWEQDIDTFPGMSPSSKSFKLQMGKYASAVKDSIKFTQDMVITSDPGWLDFWLSWVLKSHLDKGTKSCWIALDELTSCFLQHDKSSFLIVREIPVLVFKFGAEYTQQIHGYLMAHMAEYRADCRRFHTVWITQKSKGEVGKLYGQSLQANLEQRGPWLSF